MRQKYPGDILRRRFVETRRLPCQLRLEEGGKVTGRGLEDEEELLLWLYYTQVLLYCTVQCTVYCTTVLQMTPGYRPLYFPPANQSSCPASSGYGGTADGDTGADTGGGCDYGDGGDGGDAGGGG